MSVGDDLKKLKRSLGSIKEPYIAAILLFGSRARGRAVGGATMTSWFSIGGLR